MSRNLNIFSLIILIVQEIENKSYNLIRVLLRRKFFVTLLLAIACCVSILLFTVLLKNNAEAQNKEILHKYYTVVSIKDGDSLWQYANEYGKLGYESNKEYIAEVQSINHLNNVNELISGDTIILPYYSQDVL